MSNVEELQKEHMDELTKLASHSGRYPGLGKAYRLGREAWRQYGLYLKYERRARRTRSKPARRKYANRATKHLLKAAAILAEHVTIINRIACYLIGRNPIEVMKKVAAARKDLEDMSWA